MLSRDEDIELLELLQEQVKRSGIGPYAQYLDDPAGFITDVLGGALYPKLTEICESVLTNKTTVVKSGNGSGKSWLGGGLAVWFFCCRVMPCVYLFAAPPLTNLTNILWARVSQLFSGDPALLAGCVLKYLNVTRTSEQIMQGLTIPKTGTDADKKASFSGKHAPSQFFVGDEADGVADICFDGIETCQTGGFTRALYFYNPREKKGRIYEMVKDGGVNVIHISAFDHPSVIDGVDYWPGTVNREETATRIAKWTRPATPDEIIDARYYKMPGFMVGVIPYNDKGEPYPVIIAGYYKIINHEFSDVVLGEYPAQAENQLISEEWIDLALSRYDLYVAEHGEGYPKNIRCTCGLDIADGGKDNSALTRRFGNLVLPLQTWELEDVIEVGDVVASAVGDIPNLSVINCDGTGVGAGTAPYMAKQHFLPAVKVMVASSPTVVYEGGEFGILLDQLMWAVREWLRTDLAMLPPDPELIEELLAFTHETVKHKKKVSSTDDVKKKIGRSPDKARSLMFSFVQSGLCSNLDFS